MGRPEIRDAICTGLVFAGSVDESGWDSALGLYFERLAGGAVYWW